MVAWKNRQKIATLSKKIACVRVKIPHKLRLQITDARVIVRNNSESPTKNDLCKSDKCSNRAGLRYFSTVRERDVLRIVTTELIHARPRKRPVYAVLPCFYYIPCKNPSLIPCFLRPWL